MGGDYSQVYLSASCVRVIAKTIHKQNCEKTDEFINI